MAEANRKVIGSVSYLSIKCRSFLVKFVRQRGSRDLLVLILTGGHRDNGEGWERWLSVIGEERPRTKDTIPKVFGGVRWRQGGGRFGKAEMLTSGKEGRKKNYGITTWALFLSYRAKSSKLRSSFDQRGCGSKYDKDRAERSGDAAQRRKASHSRARRRDVLPLPLWQVRSVLQRQESCCAM